METSNNWITVLIEKYNKPHALLTIAIFSFSILLSFLFNIFPWQITAGQIPEKQWNTAYENIYISQSAKKTGGILAIYEGGLDATDFNKFEVYFVRGNDHGLAQLIGILSVCGLSFNDLHDLAKLNVTIYWISLILLTFCFHLYSKNHFFTALFFLFNIFFAKVYGISIAYRLADHHGLIPAIINLALSCYLFLRHYLRKEIRLSQLKIFLITITMFFCIGLVEQVRQSTASVIFVTFAISFFYFIYTKDPSNKKKTKICLLILLISTGCFSKYCGSTLTQKLIRFQTAEALGQQVKLQDVVAEKHGSWYSFFLGIGYFPNSWDIAFSDESVMGFISQRHPEVTINDPSYFPIVRMYYFRYIFENPLEFSKNILLKFNELLFFKKLTFLTFTVFLLLLVPFTLDRYRQKDISSVLFFNILFFCVLAIPLLVAPGYSQEFRTFISQCIPIFLCGLTSRDRL